MKVKIGNWSRDTMADKAITSPKSFPKCSEGKLQNKTNGVPVSSQEEPGRGGPVSATCSQVLRARPGFTLPHPPSLSPSPLLKPQNTEKALCRDPDTGCVWRGLTKTQTHKQIALCWMMSTLAKDARTECQGHKEGRHCLSHSSLGELN